MEPFWIIVFYIVMMGLTFGLIWHKIEEHWDGHGKKGEGGWSAPGPVFYIMFWPIFWTIYLPNKIGIVIANHVRYPDDK